MTHPSELKKLAEDLSHDFLQKGISLNDGLEKVAEDRGLNHNQLHRVAE